MSNFYFVSFDAREQTNIGRHKVHRDWQELGQRTNFTYHHGTYNRKVRTTGRYVQQEGTCNRKVSTTGRYVQQESTYNRKVRTAGRYAQ